ncbi:dehydrogenase with different specificitie [Corynespora cassiicola Philippines]|uniref:Dehydrogenase with different specificitie n=1 Tax=Corynespora cassiicola Philippines TaxID=1448308 RepID=A0A2T2NBB5_CORCC|nr:dehydrogenase with different specificitie [Corynespora cassiicola Philippines]
MASQTGSYALPLAGKVAIVTGASRGIGAGLALELARRGAKVAIIYSSARSEPLAAKVASQISTLANGSQALIIQADLSQVESPEKIVSATRAAYGDKIDILVNNAGVLFDGALLEITAEDYARMFDVNVRGPLLLTKAVVPHLRAPGRIINMSSVGARCGFMKLALYSASKAALEGLTRGLATELGGDGHTVNAVEPGPVQSDMMDEAPQELVELQKRTTPVQQRIGTVDDIAGIVAWLCGEESRWISGQTISASGGYAML